MERRFLIIVCIFCLSLLFGCGGRKNTETDNSHSEEITTFASELSPTQTSFFDTIEPFTSMAPADPSQPVTAVSPPGLTILSGATSALANMGGYTWSYLDSEGLMVTTNACAMHPLECRELLTPLITNDSELSLMFDSDPDKLQLTFWPDGAWGNTRLEGMEATVTDGKMEVYPGGYIYAINATWEGSDQGSGNVEYYFYVICSEN